MTKYFIGVATKDHVDLGVREGIMQVCHGKKAQLSRLKKNDIIMYYCTSKVYGKKDKYQSIAACGRVKDDKIYQFEINKDFIPWRRDVEYEQELQPVKVKEILDQLSFIKNKNRWGIYFISGLVEINFQDYEVVIEKMRNAKSEDCEKIKKDINCEALDKSTFTQMKTEEGIKKNILEVKEENVKKIVKKGRKYKV